MTTAATIGFIGLGQMGAPIAAHLAAAGHSLVVFDLAGTTARAPDGALAAESAPAVAQAAPIVFSSLPDGDALLAVVRQVIGPPPVASRTFVDLSTIGIPAAQEAAGLLAGAGVAYLDAPVSGGVAGAKAATLTVMAAGDRDVFDRIEPLLATFAAHRAHVGDAPSQGQAMKLLNNFLSGTAMVATSEALRFGRRQGLDPALMLEVLNASSGQNTATRDKFPRLLAGERDLGFRAALLAKDLRLYLEGARASATAGEVGETVAAIWAAFAAAEPEADFSRIDGFAERRAE